MKGGPLRLPSFGIFRESTVHSSLPSPITPEVLEQIQLPLITIAGKFSAGFNGPPRGRYVLLSFAVCALGNILLCKY